MYTNFNDFVKAVEGDTFVKEDNLRNMLDELASFDFAYQSERNNAKKALSGLVKERYIFNKITRFPTNHWVDIDDGDWPQLFATLRDALGFKLIAELHEKDSSNSGLTKGKDRNETGAQQYQSYYDSMLSYNHSISGMQEQIKRTVTFQQRFENKYNLVWEVPSHTKHKDKH